MPIIQKKDQKKVTSWIDLLNDIRRKTTSKEDHTQLSEIITFIREQTTTKQCIGKAQLAAHYRLSRQGFMNQLKSDDDFYGYLVDYGKYTPKQKLFTPKQVEIIKKHLG